MSVFLLLPFLSVNQGLRVFYTPRETCYFYLKMDLNGFRTPGPAGEHTALPRLPSWINERFKRKERDGMDGVEGRIGEMEKVKRGRGREVNG